MQEGGESMASHRKIKYSIKYSNTSLYEQYFYEFSLKRDIRKTTYV